MQTGFENHTDAALVKTQAALLRGLDRIHASDLDGTIDDQGPKGEAEPRQSGHLTIGLLKVVSFELLRRGLPSVAVDLDRVIREATHANRSRPPVGRRPINGSA